MSTANYSAIPGQQLSWPGLPRPSRLGNRVPKRGHRDKPGDDNVVSYDD
jgi:hypothetical protein